MNLQDLKVVVSGGGSGMGRHFAVRLADAGAQVAIGDVNEAGLAETLKLALEPTVRFGAYELQERVVDERHRPRCL